MNLRQQIKIQAEQLWKDEKKRVRLLVAMGLSGMLLLALSEWIPTTVDHTTAPTESAVAQTDSADYAQEMERRLTELISQMDGVGKTQVMVTLASGEMTVYATDTETGAEGGAKEQHVLLDGAQTPALVESVAMPQIQGVAVVCEGGGDATVQSRITELVKVLTGVGANHIAVTEMLVQGEEQP